MGKVIKLGKKFQQHLASAMCQLPFVMGRLYPLIDADMFDNEQIGDIVATAKQHYIEHHELLTSTSLSEELGSDEYDDMLETLFSVEVSDSQYVVEHVVRFAKEQALRKATIEVAGQIEKGNVDNIIEIFTDALMKGNDFSDIGHLLKEDFKERAQEYLYPEKISRIRTGLTHLDEMLCGGLDSETLGVLFGPPKAGKSSFLVNFGAGAMVGANGVNVIHYTLEMSEREVLKRYDRRLLGLKNKYIYDEKDDMRLFIKKLKKAIARNVSKGNLLVKGFPTRTATPSMLRSHLAAIIANGFNPGLVIVDYADIMKAERRIGEMRHEQASIYEDLRAIAQEFHVPVWTGSQANRGSIEKDIITIGDLAEAFEKAAIADALIAICRTADEKTEGRARLFAAAMRGKADSYIVECRVDLTSCVITSIQVDRPTLSKSSKKGKPTDEEQEREQEKSIMRQLAEEDDA